MSDHEGDGVALYATSHPIDEAAEKALTDRVSTAIRAAATISGDLYDPVADLPFYDIAAAAIAEVRKADDEFHEEMEARIEAATETVELEFEIDRWQPIETAPIGRPLFGEFGPRIMLGWENRPDHVAIGSFRGNSEFSTPIWRDGYGGALIEPTHWQPLPSPPKPKLSILNNGEKE